MLYRLEIMPPGEVESEPLAVFDSSSPFSSVAIGDLIDPTSWSAGGDDIYQVTGVKHLFQGAGEALVHTVRVYTRKTLNNPAVLKELMKPRTP